MADVIIGEVTFVDIRRAKNGSPFIVFTLVESWGYGENKKSIIYNCSTFDLKYDVKSKDKIIVFGFITSKIVKGTSYKNVEVISIMNQPNFIRNVIVG